MKRQLSGLSAAVQEAGTVPPDGLYLVRVDSALYRWHAQKPFYSLRLSVLEPTEFVGSSIASRLYCTVKAIWKLAWFLRDFLYDPELLSQNEVDERALRSLMGVVKISHTVVNGIRLVNLDGFAPASKWQELSATPAVSPAANDATAWKEKKREKSSPKHRVAP
jgi:hypothetical protein